MITAAIVDDEELARHALRLRLEREPDFRVVGEFVSAAEALPLLQRTPPDVLLLDIEMPDADGFDLLAALDPEQRPAVVFVTAHERHAVRAFGLRALDYLLKPFDDQRFADTMQRVRSRLGRSAGGESSSARAPAQAERIAIKVDGAIQFVPLSDVDWVEAAGDYVRIHVGPRSHLVRMTITAVTERLGPRLVRIHRSIAVNAAHVAAIRPLAHNDYVVTLLNGHQLRVSRRFRDRLAAALEQPLG